MLPYVLYIGGQFTNSVELEQSAHMFQDDNNNMIGPKIESLSWSPWLIPWSIMGQTVGKPRLTMTKKIAPEKSNTTWDSVWDKDQI